MGDDLLRTLEFGEHRSRLVDSATLLADGQSLTLLQLTGE